MTRTSIFLEKQDDGSYHVLGFPGRSRPTVTATFAAAGGKGASVATIRSLAVGAGVKGAKTINLSSHLSSAEDKVFKASDGWELTERGREHVALLAAKALSTSPAAAEAQTLRALLPKLKNDDTRAFVTEAIVCAEQSLFRAAVVLSWVGAISILHAEVVSKHLSAYNVEAAKREPRWKTAKNADGVGKLKESLFLEIAEVLGIIGKNVKQDLEECLKLRNGCGHPNTLKIGPNKVAAHLESLTLNVFIPGRKSELSGRGLLDQRRNGICARTKLWNNLR